MTTSTNKKENNKQLKIFAFSTGVALITILLPPIIKELLDLYLPAAASSPLVDKAIYPITAALSGLYVTWRIGVESSDLKEKIKKLERAYETKHWGHQNLVVTGLVDITIKNYRKISDLRTDAGALLKKITESNIINYSLNQMIDHLDEEYNKLNIQTENTKPNSKPNRRTIRPDNIKMGNIIKF